MDPRFRDPGTYISLLGKLYCVRFWESTGPHQGNLHCIDARSEYQVDLTDAQANAAQFVRSPARDCMSAR